MSRHPAFALHSLSPTPLVPVRIDDGPPSIWAKLEFLNPSGSTKDRIARYILGKAWRQGRLRPGDTVAEASSGSTSIAMALACAQLGVRFVALMPEGVSDERVMMIRAFGGQIRLTPRELGLPGAIAESERMSREGSFVPFQFANPDNAEAHRSGTAQEVLAQIPGGTVDVVVSGVGTGGTLVGLYQGFCEAGCPAIPVVARPVRLTRTTELECCSFSPCIPGVVEPLSTIFREAELTGLRTVEIEDSVALEAARKLIARGFPVGPSSGLNYAAAEQVARELGPEAKVVTVFPDRMERYFTTELFAPYRS